MDGGDSATSSPKRNRTRPAVRVDGQRHRLVRRSAMPRSITSPILATPSSATSSLAHSSMNTAFAPATASPTASYHSSFSISPAPTTAAGNGKKKKQGFFDSLKPKERTESSGSQDSVVVSSPLPPLTSPKASKLLGLKVGVGNTQSGQGAQGRDKDKDEGLLVRPALRKQSSLPWLTTRKNATDELTDFGGEELPVRPTLKKRSSLPWLTQSKEAAEKQTRFKEEGLEENDSPDAVGSTVRLKKLAWKEGNKKAMRMLDLLPSRNTRPKGSPNSDSQDISPLSSHLEADAEAGYSSDSNIHPHLHAKSRRYTGQLSSAAQPIALQKLSQKGRARKKGPKVLHKMTPITEASSIGEDGAVLSEEEGATTLAFINDYEGPEDLSDSTFSLPRSLTESALSRARYQLAAEDGLEDEQENKQEQNIEGHVAIIQSKLPGLQNENYYRLGKVQTRGPLQQVEHDLLDELEEQMRMNIDDHYKLIKTNEEKRMMDARTAGLSKKHDKMKEEFEKITGRKIALGRPVPAIRDDFPYQPVRQHLISKMQNYEVSEAGVSDEDEEDDLGYDSDDEATVHGVERVNFVNFTGALKVRPGVVKMIDIPPRKQKDIGRPTTKNTADEVKSIYSFKQYGQIGPISQKSGNVTVSRERLVGSAAWLIL